MRQSMFGPAMLLAPVLLSHSLLATQANCWGSEPVIQTTCNNRAPVIAVSRDGRLHLLVYVDNTSGGRGKIFYLTRLPGSAWSAPIHVADSASHATSIGFWGSEEWPVVTYSADSDQTERVRVLQAGAFIDVGSGMPGGGFGAGGQGGAVVASPSGLLINACFFGPPDEDAYAYRRSGSSWIPEVVQSTGRVGKGMKAILASDGRVMLAYYDQDQNRPVVAERSVSGAWTISYPMAQPQDATDLQLIPGGDPAQPDLALVVRDHDHGPVRILTRIAGVWQFDGSFPGAPYRVAQVAVDANRGLHIVAFDLQGRVDYLYKAGAGTAASWIVSPVAATGGTHADIALTSTGQVHIAWVLTTNGSNGEVLVRTDGCPAPYCEAKLSSGNCSGEVSYTGTASLTGPGDLVVRASNVPNRKTGLMFWGLASASTPFFGGTRCVALPLVRTAPQNSLGTPSPANDCSGNYAFQFSNAYAASQFLTPGTTVYCQFWGRDPGYPAPNNVFLTNALRFMILP